jgi:serine/threonine protein kinase
MIIMDYYRSGDLRQYITNNFEESWCKKLIVLSSILRGLHYIHSVNIIHRDLHSGNIIFNDVLSAVICDLGISKSSTASTDDDEIYGIIPYTSPEVFQEHKYTTASDIYSFGMIMWEFMTGRRPFWNRTHDTDLIIQICDGLRPPIVTNAPEGYIELMQKCWHPNPNERPTASDILGKLDHIRFNEHEIPTKIIPSSDIGPVIANNLGAIYESRPLSSMIKSAMFTRSLKSQFVASELGNYL